MSCDGSVVAPTPEAANAVGTLEAVRAVRSGDREAFARLLDLYEARLYGVALMTTRDPTGAAEVTQEAFVRAYTHLDQFDERRQFYPWLATIAVRAGQSWLRRRARFERRERAFAAGEGNSPSDDDPLRNIIADERKRRLWRAVEQLPTGQRTAVVLYYRDQMKIREIARALGVATGTVKTQLHRARNQLRRRPDLVDFFGNEG